MSPNATGTSYGRRDSRGGLEFGHDSNSNEQGNLQQSIEIHAGRIVRLGKKLSDMDGDVGNQFKNLGEEISLLSQRLNMIVDFLPRRQRMLVEKNMNLDKDDREEATARSRERKKEGKRPGQKLNFDDTPQIRTYEVTQEASMPWQLVGEPDQKWSWCMQPVNEMGRDLARYFEQMEHEREEFEEQVKQQTKQMVQTIMSSRLAGFSSEDALKGADRFSGRGTIHGNNDRAATRMDFDDARLTLSTPPEAPYSGSPQPHAAVSAESVEKIQKKIERAILPQMSALEDRIQQLVGDCSGMKKALENQSHGKAEKEEVQVIAIRLAAIEKTDVKAMLTRLETMECDSKYSTELLDQLGANVRRVEGMCAARADLLKLRSDVQSISGESKKLQGTLQEQSASIFQANRQVTGMLKDMKETHEKFSDKVQTEKANVSDVAGILDRMTKLEGSMKDNRQILDSSGGNEVNAVVKRIILNMEDKIMVIERKVEALLEASSLGAGEGPPGDVGGSPPGSPGMGPRPTQTSNQGAQEGAALALGQEISSMSQILQELKQEAGLRKADLEMIAYQGQQHMDLAQRLNVVVESAGGSGVGSGPEQSETVLSMSRVQVMIAAAARQLVAGSKWITKETFDLRLGEIRSEYLRETRQLQMRLEDTVQVMNASSRVPPVPVLPTGSPPSGGGGPRRRQGGDPALTDAIQGGPSTTSLLTGAGPSTASLSSGQGNVAALKLRAAKGPPSLVDRVEVFASAGERPPGTAPALPSFVSQGGAPGPLAVGSLVKPAPSPRRPGTERPRARGAAP